LIEEPLLRFKASAERPNSVRQPAHQPGFIDKEQKEENDDANDKEPAVHNPSPHSNLGYTASAIETKPNQR